MLSSEAARPLTFLCISKQSIRFFYKIYNATGYSIMHGKRKAAKQHLYVVNISGYLLSATYIKTNELIV